MFVVLGTEKQNGSGNKTHSDQLNSTPLNSTSESNAEFNNLGRLK